MRSLWWQRSLSIGDGTSGRVSVCFCWSRENSRFSALKLARRLSGRQSLSTRQNRHCQPAPITGARSRSRCAPKLRSIVANRMLLLASQPASQPASQQLIRWSVCNVRADHLNYLQLLSQSIEHTLSTFPVATRPLNPLPGRSRTRRSSWLNQVVVVYVGLESFTC